MGVKVKICGITRPEDAVNACQSGVDAIGLVFYKPSPRNVSIEQAREIVQVLPPFVSVVALFVDADSSEIYSVLQNVEIDLIQFHGSESAEFCESFNKRYIKVIHMQEAVDLGASISQYPSSCGILLDTFQKELPGGTGRSFDWHLVPEYPGKPLIIAGGLTPSNVGDAIKIVRPYAVDVSGGVELSKGIKDAGKIADFINQVHRC